MKRFADKRGSVLLMATGILYVLLVTGVSFSLANVGEINASRRFYHSSAAFWLAEAGVNMFMSDPNMLNDGSLKDIAYGGGRITLSKDDSKPMYRFVTATGFYGQFSRAVQISYPANVPEPYRNIFSTAGNITVSGGRTAVVINGKTRVGGKVSMADKNQPVFFEDLKTAAKPAATSLHYPSLGPSEGAFAAFLRNNRELIGTYPANEVLHISNRDSYTLGKDSVSGKKIVFVDGGSAVINSKDLLKPNQNVTVISTGTVTLNQAGMQASGSQLNIIAWGGYNETVSAPSSFRGLIYTHGRANFDKITDTSITEGGIIADGGIKLGDIWSTKLFNYADMTKNGLYPPGFERLQGSGSGGVSAKPNSWREVKT